MTANEVELLLGEVRRLLGVPNVGAVLRRRLRLAELVDHVGKVPDAEWFFVLAHPAVSVDDWCGCLRAIRVLPHAAVRRAGPSGVLRNPKRLNDLAVSLGRPCGSRLLTADDGRRLVQLLHKINDERRVPR